MYRSNQARIKKKIPSILLGRGQGPRPASSLPSSPSRYNYGREQYPLYCSTTGTVAACRRLSLSSLPLNLAAT